MKIGFEKLEREGRREGRTRTSPTKET